MSDESPTSPTDGAPSTLDFLEERRTRLRELVPEAFPDGALDLEKLGEAVGVKEVEDPGRYLFTWSGKEHAVESLKEGSHATLVPDREASIDFDTTGHVFIDGENLEVLKLLYKSYFGRVRMAYIDPPYNTGNDFIYRDNWADPLDAYLRATGQAGEEGNVLTSAPETGGRYHSRWLSLMYPRLLLARQLLREDGVIFVSIDDNELHHLRMIMNEIFGEENFITTVIWQKIFTRKNTARHFSVDHDYVVVYARDAEIWRPNLLPRTEEADARYSNPDGDPRGSWTSSPMTARNYYSEGEYEITAPGGRTFSPPPGRYWSVNKETFEDLDEADRIWWGEDDNSVPRLKRFRSDVKEGLVPKTIWPHQDVGHTQEAKTELKNRVKFNNTANVINTVKPTRLVRRMLRLATDPDGEDLVLDFFAGSAVTADAVLQQNREDGGNRKFVCVQFPEPLPKPQESLATLSDVAMARIRGAVKELRVSDGAQRELGEEEEVGEDLGVRVFRLARSHIRRWPDDLDADIEPGEYVEQMEEFLDPLEDGWKPEPLLYEIALREGFGLNVNVEEVESVEENTVQRVIGAEDGRGFHICLDDDVRAEVVEELGLGKEDLFICRDAALDDETALNLGLRCRLKTI